MKKILLITILLSGLFFISASDTKAQSPPPGSYLKSCGYKKLFNGPNLEATCMQKGGAYSETVLQDYFLCDGDISNQDGYLNCKKSDNNPLMLKAREAIVSAYPNYFGESYKGTKEETRSYLRKMLKLGMNKQFSVGLSGTDAAAFFESFVKKPENNELRLQIINRAYGEVYGTGSVPPQRVAFWNSKAGTTGNFYKDVKLGEIQALNSDQIARTLMIGKVYKSAMGRPATKDELAYWKPKTEHYAQLLAAARNWLYSPNGSKDLVETVQRAISGNSDKAKPTNEQVNQAIIKFTKTKAIYDEMPYL